MDKSTAGAASLETLRQKIDEIDDAIHDALMERIEIALEIGRETGWDCNAQLGVSSLACQN